MGVSARGRENALCSKSNRSRTKTVVLMLTHACGVLHKDNIFVTDSRGRLFLQGHAYDACGMFSSIFSIKMP